MSNSHNLQSLEGEEGGGRVIAKTYHVTQTKHENRQIMEKMDTCFCKESFIDRSFLVLEILRLHKPKKSGMNTVNTTDHM